MVEIQTSVMTSGQTVGSCRAMLRVFMLCLGIRRARLVVLVDGIIIDGYGRLSLGQIYLIERWIFGKDFCGPLKALFWLKRPKIESFGLIRGLDSFLANRLGK